MTDNKRLTLLKTVTDSMSSGTDIEGSDVDSVTIVTDTVSEMIGIAKRRKGKFSPSEAEDATVYTLYHLFDMLLKGSANATNILYMPPESWEAGTDFEMWKRMYDARLAFLGKSTYFAFLKYAEQEIRDGIKEARPKKVAQGMTLVNQLEHLIYDPTVYAPMLNEPNVSVIRGLKRGVLSIDKAMKVFNTEARLIQLQCNVPDWKQDREVIDALKVKLSLILIRRLHPNL